MNLNTKILIGILAVVTVGVVAVIAGPSIREARERAAAKQYIENAIKEESRPKPNAMQSRLGGETLREIGATGNNRF